MAKIKEIVFALKEAILNAAYPHRRESFSRMVDTRLLRHYYQDKAYHSTETGITQSLVSDREITVSLTTHSKRILTVHRTIESLMQQSVHPNRIVLYLGNREFQHVSQLPIVLQRQVTRGLQVRFVDDIGPYTKLIPALRDFPDSHIIVFDDDNYYPINSIERLINAHQCLPTAICGLLTRTLELTSPHRFKNYLECRFERNPTDTVSPFYIAEGVGGVLFPAHSLPDEVFNFEVFQRLAPKADDLWYKAMSLLNDTPVLNVHSFFDIDYERYVDFDVQDIGLFYENLWQGGNNAILNALFDHYQLWDKLYH